MAISAGDVQLKLGLDKGTFDRDLSSTTSNLQRTTEKWGKSMRIAGLAMVAAATGVVVAMGAMVNMAAKEEAGIERLRMAMQNVGLNYDANRDSIEGVIDAMQQKTAVADDAQRESLASLITMTGDLTRSQGLLSLAMDISAGTGKDLSSVTATLGYALAGNWGMVNRMIPALADVQTEEEKWLFLRERFAGQAEAYGATLAGQMQLLKNNASDVGEMIGGVLIPAVTALTGRLNTFLQTLKATDPALLKLIVGVGGAATALLGLGGAALIVLSYVPRIVAGFQLITASAVAMRLALLGVKGALIVAGVALLAYIGYLVYENRAYGDRVRNMQKMMEVEQRRQDILRLATLQSQLATTASEESRMAIQAEIDALGLWGEAAVETITSASELSEALQILAFGWMQMGLSEERALYWIEQLESKAMLLPEIQYEITEELKETAEALDSVSDRLHKVSDDLVLYVNEVGQFNLITSEAAEWLQVFEDATYSVDESIVALGAHGVEALQAMGLSAEEAALVMNRYLEGIEDGADEAVESLQAITQAVYDNWAAAEDVRQQQAIIAGEAAAIVSERLVRNWAQYVLAGQIGLPAVPRGYESAEVPYLTVMRHYLTPEQIAAFTAAAGEANILQHGGIVTRPTLALLGEAGREAVIPLDRSGYIGGAINLNVYLDSAVLVRALGVPMAEEIRIKTGMM